MTEEFPINVHWTLNLHIAEIYT